MPAVLKPDAPLSQLVVPAKLAVMRTACGICALPEAELLAELEKLYWQGAKDMVEKMMPLYQATNSMMAVLGANGEICARDDRVTAVMDALHSIDGGTVIKPNAQAQPDSCRNGGSNE